MSTFTTPAPVAERPRGRRTRTKPEPDTSKPWDIRVPHRFLDARLNKIDPRHLKMLLVLEGVCRSGCHHWIGNAQLAARYGCSYRHCQTILAEMQALGMIHRVLTRSGPLDRIGIILRVRADHRLPAADSDEALASALESLGEGAEGTPDLTSPGANPSAPGALDRSCTRALDPAHLGLQGSLSFKDGSEEEFARDSDQRSRSKTAETRPEPQVIPGEDRPATAPPGPPQAPPPESPGLTPGQVEFLDRLSPDQRARFEGWPEGRRASTLEAFARCFDPVIFGETAKQLAPPGPKMPDRSTPTPELIAYLAGHMGPSLAAMCSRAIMVELDDQGGQKSYEVIYRLCGDVVAGTLDPEDLAVPLANTLVAIRSGKPISNPAGYWMRGVKNRVRERPPN